MRKKAQLSFNVLITKDNGQFVAHCLELDIVCVAETENKVMKELSDSIVNQVSYALSNDNVGYLYRPAPDNFWKEYLESSTRVEGELHVYEIPEEKRVRPDIKYPVIGKNVISNMEEAFV